MLSQAIASYQTLRKIGAGGVGTVYEAVRPDTGARAAVKIVRPAWMRGKDRLVRFLLDSRAVGTIPHPGIVPVFEGGMLGERSAYLAMELLEGETLSRRRVRAGGRLGAEAVRFGRQIASVLAAAHARGIVHGDLRSHNVMIVAQPATVGGERCKVMDFGLAQLCEPSRPARRADAAGDVYSLAKVMMEIIAGVPPLWPRRLAQLLPLSRRHPVPALRRMAPEVPAALDRLVARMLAPAPEDRPTMLDVAQELAALEGIRVCAGGKLRAWLDDAVPAALGWGRLPAVIERGREVGASAAGIALVTSPSPSRVRVSVRSFPSGAEVIRASDDELLGVTPFTAEREPSDELMNVVVRLRGFEPYRMAIDLRRDRDELVRLRSRA